MNREELLRRLEERLARGEISERTYLDIKARYDAMPDLPPTSEAPPPPQPPTWRWTWGNFGRASAPEAPPPESQTPPAPSEGPRHAGHRRARVRVLGHEADVVGNIDEIIEGSIAAAMEAVSASLDASSASSDEMRRRMDEVSRRIEEKMSKFGPRIEEGGEVCVIRGSGTVPGGQHFREFKCAGSGTVTGDLLADEAHISGACVVEGRCVGQEFHASGRAEIGKDVQVEEFHVSGRASVGGDVRAKEVQVSGSAKIGGGITAEEVDLQGAVSVGGAVKTREFTSRGQFAIGGGIEAEEVDVRLAGHSKTSTIKAREVEVRRGERHGELVAESIEGEEVYLEATRAGLVRGHSVRLGPYSSIHAVEADELEVHETATFQERRARTG